MYHNHTKYANQTRSELGIEYKFNYYGFRDWEFPDKLEFVALGCSHTLGEGINCDDSWPSQLSELISNKVYNAGVSNAAMDTVYRISKELIPRHNPDVVFMFSPPSLRFEMANENDTWDVVNIHAHRAEYTDRYFLYDQNSYVNFVRNLDAIKNICTENNAKLIYLTADHDFRADHAAADGFHSGPEVMLEIAERFYTMYQEIK